MSVDLKVRSLYKLEDVNKVLATLKWRLVTAQYDSEQRKWTYLLAQVSP